MKTRKRQTIFGDRQAFRIIFAAEQLLDASWNWPPCVWNIMFDYFTEA